jgi:hypothetical protein
VPTPAVLVPEPEPEPVLVPVAARRWPPCIQCRTAARPLSR